MSGRCQKYCDGTHLYTTDSKHRLVQRASEISNVYWTLRETFAQRYSKSLTRAGRRGVQAAGQSRTLCHRPDVLRLCRPVDTHDASSRDPLL
jgi:hypothetical protein